MSKRTRPRSSYHNVKSYDDTLELVLELLEESEKYEEAIVQPFIEAYEKLCELYEREAPQLYARVQLPRQKAGLLPVDGVPYG